MECKKINITVLGKSGTGKTSLIYRYIFGNFPEDPESTIEDTLVSSINVNGEQYQLEILDTSGNEEYFKMLNSWCRFASVIMLVYSLEDLESINYIRKVYFKLSEEDLKQKDYTLLLVQNKCDIDSSSNCKLGREQIKKYSSEWKVENIESSALANLRVKEAFLKLCQLSLRDKSQDDNEKKTSSAHSMRKTCFCF